MIDHDIDRIDHSVLYTTDMDATAATYEALGFTLSPLSLHMAGVLLVVDDADLEATVARYARTLGTEPVAAGPLHVRDLEVGRMEILAVSDFEEVLPGEPVPALPYLRGRPWRPRTSTRPGPW